jgi:hypothetical protein
MWADSNAAECGHELEQTIGQLGSTWSVRDNQFAGKTSAEAVANDDIADAIGK